MIRFIHFLLFLIASLLGFSQERIASNDDLLTIVLAEDDDSVVKMYTYPPKSTVKLLGLDGKAILPKEKSIGFYESANTHEILVYPSHTKNPIQLQTEGLKTQVYTNKKAAKKNGIKYFWHDRSDKHWKENTWSNESDVSIVKKTVTPSEVFEGNVNTEVVFSNGVTFIYNDGAYSATLDGNPLPIEGKYIIALPNGFLKMSYNPKNAKIWYIFTKE